MTVLSTLGITESYTNVVIKNKRCQRKKKIELTPRPASIDNTTPPAITSTSERESIPLSCYSGTLRQLSDSMCAQAWQIAATGLYSNVYDNINMMFRSPEQIIGHHDTQENGTGATLIPLFKARIEDLKTVDYQAQFLAAPRLKLTDNLHTPQVKKHLIFTILCIIIKNGGDGFQKFEGKLKDQQPATSKKIELHKSDLHPLLAWKIDESSIIEMQRLMRRLEVSSNSTKYPTPQSVYSFMVEINFPWHAFARSRTFMQVKKPGSMHSLVQHGLLASFTERLQIFTATFSHTGENPTLVEETQTPFGIITHD
ncbi:hypothetical protein K443DRAFT_6141 [Laccaria amethystina LaAM-08-1]|uniref:DUF6589 domain-containing protein n=1 Tax=Laccaria amethystina LaAM-08-1 TaxID=1095629 RepID=A0A0C9XCF1_9AGAR|nr:hypothetical protein K443DRAFT_6141 [Laccaria amethystina LaAM-08-1]